MIRTGCFLLPLDLFACLITGGIKYVRERDQRRQTTGTASFFLFPSLSSHSRPDGDAVAFGQLIIDSGLIYSVVFGLWTGPARCIYV